MHVGKGMFLQSFGADQDDQFVVSAEAAMGIEAEALGFDSLWCAEHHFRGYHLCPNPIQLLTYFAARTSRIQLGTNAIILPWHDPVRVAEELAMLDCLSGGRMLVGFGRGLGRVEFDGLRVEMGESRGRFVEYAEAVVEAFDTGLLSYEGTFYKQPPAPLRPAPMAPLRGRIYASTVSPESFDIMARLGFGVMVIAQKTWETTVSELNTYRDRYEDANGEPPPRPILVSLVAVHESEARAQEMYEEYLVTYSRSAVEHYEFGNTAFAEIPGYEYYGRLAQRINQHGLDAFARFLASLQVWGTPDQVVEQLTEYGRMLDVGAVVTVLSYGGMPLDLARANHQLFSSAVLPRLKAIDPERSLATPVGRSIATVG